MSDSLLLSLAQKLVQLLNGGTLPASQLKGSVVVELLNEGILYKSGKRKNTIQLIDRPLFDLFLKTRFGINDLQAYIEVCTKENATRAEAVEVSGDSKLNKVRTFKGFLVNTYQPISCTLNGSEMLINPVEGTFQFIYDFENFVPPAHITIVGIENPESFRFIAQQKYLFENIKPIFVSRYPQNQSKDLIKWLQTIPNDYLHFGDFDFAGINIYLSEYQQYLGRRSRFFIPKSTDYLIEKFGNKNRYDNQRLNYAPANLPELALTTLLNVIHKHKKGLDQEVFIRGLDLYQNHTLNLNPSTYSNPV